MAPPLRVAIAGTGFIGRVHARSARLAGARIVAVAASTPERSDVAALELGADRAAASAEELATADDVDVLHICTPNHLHAPLALAALAEGKDVVCEKPLAVSAEQAAEVVAAAAAAGRGVAVPFVYRYHPLVRHARALAAAGELGDIRLIHGSYLQDWLLEPGDGNWRVHSSLGGRSRTFADIGSHWCDLAEFVTGHRFTSVSASLPTFLPERPDAGHAPSFGDRRISGDRVRVDTEDAAVVLLRTDLGAVGSVVVSQVSPGRKNQLWIEVDGSRRAVAFDQEQPERLWLGARAGDRVVKRDEAQLQPSAARYSVLPPGHPQGYHDCFDAFVAEAYAAFRTGEVPDGMPTAADGERAALITDAVLGAASVPGWQEIAAAGVPA